MPVKSNDIEVVHGPIIPTYFLMKQLEAKYGDQYEFYFILGSDLIPGLITWDEGQKLIDEVKFIVFERKGYEHILDEKVEKEYLMPKHYVVIKAH